MEKKRIILPTKRFFGADTEDLNLRIGLDETRNLLREGDRTIILDTSVLFDKERNESPYYKIHGKMKMVFRNLYSGESDYPPLSEKLYLLGDGSNGDFTGYLPYDEYAFIRKDVIKEVITPPSTSNLTSYTPTITVTGQSDHINIDPSVAPFYNWNLYLTYVHSSDDKHIMKYTLSGGTYVSFTAGDGIPFRVTDNGQSYKLTSPVHHGIVEGEYITISGGTLTSSVAVSGRTFSVISVGDNNYDSENYVLEISKSELPSGTTLSTIILGKRCIDRDNITGTTSTYYVHKHKTLTTSTGYTIDKVGFESPIWEDEKKLVFENIAGDNDVLVERNRMESILYDFREPLTLTGITNNLGYTPTEAYVTMVFRNQNGYFDYPFKVGYKFNFHDTWIDNHFSGTTSIENTVSGTTFTNTISGQTYNFKKGDEIPVGTELTGAFVEYNRVDLKERIISEAYHKITTPLHVLDHQQDDPTVFSGTSSGNTVGLFYQSHNRVKLREMSPYIETSKTNEVYGLPQNAKYFEEEGLWKWRDVYDHGFIDPDGFGTNYPFLNNMHYVKNDINFYLRNEQLYTNKVAGLKRAKLIC